MGFMTHFNPVERRGFYESYGNSYEIISLFCTLWVF